VRKFWLMNQHGDDGPTALVATDGRLQVVDIIQFGASITELDDQQKIWDDVIGRVAPTLKPCVNAETVDEAGIEPHAELRRTDPGQQGGNRAARRDGGQASGGAGRSGATGPSRTGSRGER